MQTVFQLAIGLAPLIIASIIFLLGRKIKILPVVSLCVCAAALIVSGITSAKNKTEEKKAKEQKVVSTADYIYLAGNDMVNGNLDRAEEFLRELYAVNGETPEGTLANARVQVFRGDFVGAALLYGKLEKNGHKDILSEMDGKILAAIADGTIMNPRDASAALAEIEMLENAGADITEYGYTEEQADSLREIVAGDYDPVAELAEELDEELEEQRKDNKAYANATEILESAEVIDQIYDAYASGAEYSEEKLAEAEKVLDKAYEDSESMLSVNAIGIPYVKTKVMRGKGKDVAAYIEGTGSQYAIAAASQMIIDGELREKDLPAGFISISANEQKAVAAQCRQAMANVKSKKKIEGAKLKEIEDKYNAVESMSDDLLLAEMTVRLDTENLDYKYESPLHMSASAVYYAMGNTDMGDIEFGKSIESAPYYADVRYVSAVAAVNSVINDVADINEVKNVGDYIAAAYDIAVPHVNPEANGKESDGRDDEWDDGSDSDKDDKDDWNSAWDDDKDKDIPDEDRKPDKPKEDEKKLSAVETLTAQGTTYVSKQKAVTNIGRIDVENFPEVSFNLQTAKPLDLKNPGLIINDCGINITDYTIKKNDFDKAKIYAVCDKSGSMEGSTDSLQAAVRSLAGSISKKEQMGVIGFSDHVEFQSGMKTSASELDSYIEQLVANGGTNIAAGTFAALDEIGGSEDSINVVIVMTDGEDSSFSESTLESIRSICDDGHTIVYTLGLGSSVNADYLRTIANAGNGKFVYSFSASELEALYSFIHSQMENNYTVTFTAKDTKKNERTLTVTNTNDGSVTTKDYTLGLEEGEEEEEEEEELPFEIDGFASKKLYAKDTEIPAIICGKGFEEDMTCYVSITGEEFKGSFEGTFISDTKFKVVFPAKVPPGKYSATISIGEGKAEDEIEIMSGEIESVTFGAYTFTASKIELTEDEAEDGKKGDKHYVLNGDITMNSFLHFNGTLLLDGDFESDEITMTDQGGSYIIFDKPQKALLGFITMTDQNFDPVGEYKLHKDPDHMNDFNEYKVESVLTKGFKLPAISTVGSETSIYPHLVKVKYAEFTLSLPMQSQFLSLAGIDFGTSIEGGYTAIIDRSGSYSKGKASLSNDDGLTNFAVKQINAFAWNPTEINLEFDTFKHDYAFTLKGTLSWMSKKFALVDNEVKTVAQKGSRGDGFSFSISEGYLDEFIVYIDHECVVPTEVGPVTFDNFFLGFSNLKEAYQKTQKSQSWSDILYAEVTGGCNISLEKISSLLGSEANPIVKKLFGDLSLLTLDSITLKGAFKNFHLTAKADVKLFGEFNCGTLEFAIGNYKYEDYYLGMSEREVFGIKISTSIGPNIELTNLKVVGQGTDMMVINNVLSALRRSGKIEYDITVFDDWWNWKGEYEGTFEIAFKPVNGKPRLIIAMYGNKNDNKKGIRYVFANSWLPTKEYF